MSLCPSHYTLVTGTNYTYFVILSSFAFSLTLFGSLTLIKTTLKAKAHPPITRLVFYTAIWDILYVVSIMFYQLNLGTEGTQTLCLVYLLHYITVTCSLACIATITISGILMSRIRQNQFNIHYKLFLLITYILAIAYFGVLYIFQFVDKGAILLVLEYAPGTILYLVIVFGTIRLLMIMKKMDMELVDRTPIYLSLTMLVFYTVIFIADWVNISDFNFTWFMLANFLKLSAGFVNFLVGYKRTKKVVDELNETPKGITIESNQTSLMYRNDLTSYLNYTES